VAVDVTVEVIVAVTVQVVVTVTVQVAVAAGEFVAVGLGVADGVGLITVTAVEEGVKLGLAVAFPGVSEGVGVVVLDQVGVKLVVGIGVLVKTAVAVLLEVAIGVLVGVARLGVEVQVEVRVTEGVFPNGRPPLGGFSWEAGAAGI
jgi:hypothetical protein